MNFLPLPPPLLNEYQNMSMSIPTFLKSSVGSRSSAFSYPKTAASSHPVLTTFLPSASSGFRLRRFSLRRCGGGARVEVAEGALQRPANVREAGGGVAI